MYPQFKTKDIRQATFLVLEIIRRVFPETAFPGQTFIIFVSLRKHKCKFIFFLIQHNVSAIQNQSLFLDHVLSLRDNLTSLSTNGFPVSNFPNFGIAPKTKFKFIFFIIQNNVSVVLNQILSLGHVLSSRDNLTSLTRYGFPGSNFPNFGFAPKTKFKFICFLIQNNVSAIQNQSLFLDHVLSLRDNLKSLSTNGFPGTNFHNFGFAPQTQI